MGWLSKANASVHAGAGPAIDYQKKPFGRFGGTQARNLNRRGGRWPRPPLVSVDSFGSLCHLRWQQPTGLTLPSVPSKVNSYRPAFPGRSIFAEGADRAHRSFRSLANIGVLRAGRAQPLYLLTPAGRFALRATARRADASLRRAFRSLCHLRWQVSRLLNHSRFPNGRAHGFAAPLRVALGLRPKCPQGTRFPSRHRAGASLRCRAGGEFAPLGANIS